MFYNKRIDRSIIHCTDCLLFFGADMNTPHQSIIAQEEPIHKQEPDWLNEHTQGRSIAVYGWGWWEVDGRVINSSCWMHSNNKIKIWSRQKRIKVTNRHNHYGCFAFSLCIENLFTRWEARDKSTRRKVGDGVGRHGNSVLGMTWNCLVCILSGLFLGICGGTWLGANV